MPPPPPRRERPDPLNSGPGRAPLVAGSCILGSLLAAIVLVSDGMIPHPGISAPERQAILVKVYGSAIALTQLVAAGAMISWWRSRR